MLPGGQKLKDAMAGQVPERELKRVMAMIDSMTLRERRDHTVINGSRKEDRPRKRNQRDGSESADQAVSLRAKNYKGDDRDGRAPPVGAVAPFYVTGVRKRRQRAGGFVEEGNTGHGCRRMLSNVEGGRQWPFI